MTSPRQSGRFVKPLKGGSRSSSKIEIPEPCQIERVGNYVTAELPDPRVVTIDRVPIEFGMKLYTKYTPTRCVEYEEILGLAFQDPHTKEWKVLVVGPKLPIVSYSATNFVSDPSLWAEFWERRNG